MAGDVLLKAATATQADLRKQIADVDAIAVKLRHEHTEAIEEIARIRAAEAEEAGAALLDGASVPPEISDRRRKEIGRLRKIAENTAAALDQIPGRRVKLQEALAASVPEFTDAALDEISRRRLAALEKVRIGLVGIAEPLAELTASDMLERDLLGQEFAFDPAKHSDLFAGRVVASRFLDALPVRLTPDELDSFAVRSNAVEIAARWLQDITGESK